MMNNIKEGPLHVSVTGLDGTQGIVACENIKLIDPETRYCMRIDRIPYDMIMNVSDILQGLFEYD